MLPLHLLQQKELIERVIKHGLRLQTDLESTTGNNPEERWDSPQMLWERFKEDIQEITKELLAEIHYKINSHILRLEKDRAALANAPDTDRNNDTHTSEAIIASKITHLEERCAKGQKEKLSTELVLHGKKLGGAWSAMNKDRKPRDLIRRLHIPHTTPPQYECNLERMVDLAKNVIVGCAMAKSC